MDRDRDSCVWTFLLRQLHKHKEPTDLSSGQRCRTHTVPLTLNSDKCVGLPYEDVVLLSRVVILQGSAAAKYKSCSRGVHSDLMKSGWAQEESGPGVVLYCTSDSQTNKVRGEWSLNIIRDYSEAVSQWGQKHRFK